MSTIIYNKKAVSSKDPCISHNDRGFTLGHGFFETLLIKQGVFPTLDYHWVRLISSAPILGITLPFSYEELQAMLTELVSKNNLQDKLASARITITHGEASRGILPTETPCPNFLITMAECEVPHNKPYSALVVKIRKNEHSLASRVKTISYLDNILAKQEARQQGYDEAILLNTAANVADGSISNIFMVKDNQVFTPPISDGALPGVIRAIVLQEFSNAVCITEKTISHAELTQADEIFLTNALLGIKSVANLDGRMLPSFCVANQLSVLLREKKNYI